MKNSELKKLAKGADNIEVNPIKVLWFQDGEQVCEQCDEKDADFYSVFFHTLGVGLECVADLPNEAEANILASKLSKEYNLTF